MDNSSSDTMVSHYVRPEDALRKRPFLMAGIFSRSAKDLFPGASLRSGLITSLPLAGCVYLAFTLHQQWLFTYVPANVESLTLVQLANTAGELALLILMLAFTVMAVCTGRTAARMAESSNELWTLGRNPIAALATICLTTLYCCFAPIIVSTTAVAVGNLVNDGAVSQRFIAVCAVCFVAFFIGYAKVGFAPIIAASEGVSVRNAFKKSIAITQGARLKVGLLLLLSNLVWVLGYLVFVLPGMAIFEWNQLNLVATMRRLTERSRRLNPEEMFVPVRVNSAQIFTNS